MNHPSPKSVTTIREFLALIEKAAGTAEHFGFRGQKNRSWNLECGAYRRLRDFDNLNSSRGSDLQEKFLQYHRDRLIRPARNYNFDTRAGREIGDLEVLAKLQHSGAATCLLDFTRNALVALWIACESDEQEGSEVDGKVFVVELSDRSRFREASQNDAREKDNVSRFLSARDDPRSVLSWYWEPPMVDDIATRTLRQHSIFVFGQPVLSEELAYTVIVSGKAKKDILKELESRHNLSSETLFQDLSGFCSANSQTSPLREVGTSSTYYSQGTTAYGQSNFEAAVMEFTEGLCLRPDRADLYLGRAHARTS